MRAGKLKTRRYKVRKRGWGWLLLLLVGAGLGAAAVSFQQGLLSVSLPAPFITFPAAPTHPPEERQAEERVLTLPGRTWYALQLGAFNESEDARRLAASYQGRGAAGYVLRREAYLVLAAAYPTRAEAQAVVSQLKSQHQVEAQVVEISQIEITLRLSGQRGQLTALSDALDALSQLSDQLSAFSIALDKQAMDASALQSALKSQRETLAALSARLQGWFSQEELSSVRDIADALSALTSSLDSCLEARGGTALGAALKYAQLQCVCRLAAYAEKLSQ